MAPFSACLIQHPVYNALTHFAWVCLHKESCPLLILVVFVTAYILQLCVWCFLCYILLRNLLLVLGFYSATIMSMFLMYIPSEQDYCKWQSAGIFNMTNGRQLQSMQGLSSQTFERQSCFALSAFRMRQLKPIRLTSYQNLATLWTNGNVYLLLLEALFSLIF